MVFMSEFLTTSDTARAGANVVKGRVRPVVCPEL